jgi:hypothetical protein
VDGSAGGRVISAEGGRNGRQAIAHAGGLILVSGAEARRIFEDVYFSG